MGFSGDGSYWRNGSWGKEVAGREGDGLGFIDPATAVTVGSAGGPVGVAVALAVSAVTTAFTFFISRNKARNAEKVLATQIVNDAEPYFKQNLDSFLSSPKNANEKAAYLQNFDAMWAKLSQLLSDTRLQKWDIGQKSLQERGRDGRPSWGKNWFELYRDPIESTPSVEVGQQWASSLGLQSSSQFEMLLVAGLAGLAGLMFFGSD